MPEWPHVAAPPILDHFRTQSDISIYPSTRLSRLCEERLLGFEPADHGGSLVMNSADHCVPDRRLNPPANTQATFQNFVCSVSSPWQFSEVAGVPHAACEQAPACSPWEHQQQRFDGSFPKEFRALLQASAAPPVHACVRFCSISRMRAGECGAATTVPSEFSPSDWLHLC